MFSPVSDTHRRNTRRSYTRATFEVLHTAHNLAQVIEILMSPPALSRDLCRFHDRCQSGADPMGHGMGMGGHDHTVIPPAELPPAFIHACPPRGPNDRRAPRRNSSTDVSDLCVVLWVSTRPSPTAAKGGWVEVAVGPSKLGQLKMPSRQERRRAERDAAKRAQARAGAAEAGRPAAALANVNVIPLGDWTTQADDPYVWPGGYLP